MEMVRRVFEIQSYRAKQNIALLGELYVLSGLPSSIEGGKLGESQTPATMN